VPALALGRVRRAEWMRTSRTRPACCPSSCAWRPTTTSCSARATCTAHGRKLADGPAGAQLLRQRLRALVTACRSATRPAAFKCWRRAALLAVEPERVRSNGSLPDRTTYRPGRAPPHPRGAIIFMDRVCGESRCRAHRPRGALDLLCSARDRLGRHEPRLLVLNEPTAPPAGGRRGGAPARDLPPVAAGGDE